MMWWLAVVLFAGPGLYPIFKLRGGNSAFLVVDLNDLAAVEIDDG